jgi:hypothetical protein
MAHWRHCAKEASRRHNKSIKQSRDLQGSRNGRGKQRPLIGRQSKVKGLDNHGICHQEEVSIISHIVLVMAQEMIEVHGYVYSES